jgi:pimeloyl-ACP methyl ester carboxylesterase
MSGKKTRLQIVERGRERAAERLGSGASARREPTQVSGRWLVAAVGGTIAAAALCGWGVLCLLFWQGSWQLLYHPAAEVTHIPESAGITYDSVAFDPSDEGTPQLKGWWIPAGPSAAFGRYTVLFLHSQSGNLGDTVDSLARLHAVGLNILAFDYRGYGQSQFVRPSEAHWRQDAESALEYLTATRHVDADSIVLDGEGLGANLALEVGAAHPELAGVILESPIESPMNVIFYDARAHLVPARLLVRDRFDLVAAAKGLRIPALWFEFNAQNGHDEPAAYREIAGHKTLVWLQDPESNGKQFTDALSRWLDDLPHR